jgi:hypothetical protein
VLKAKEPCDSQHPLILSLADGSRWTIVGVDEPAALAVARLGRTMRLASGVGDREVYAVVCRDRMHDPQTPSRNGAVVCWLSPLFDPYLQVIQMDSIAASIALQLLPRGGLLLHGALADYKGAGYVMAGPSGVGKSTSSRRLPPPHRSLCDDRTLVVCDRAGRYWAHPWPTWSRLFNRDLNASWPVEEAVPLRGIFFLSQAASERLQPTSPTQAAALIMESAIDLARTVTRLSEAGESPRLWEDHLAAAKSLAAAVPVCSLEMSLHGRFWSEIEQVLSAAGDLGIRPSFPDKSQSSLELLPANARNSRSSPPGATNGRLSAVCLGHAMEPTLAEADILEVEPYGQRRVLPGDVVCFKSPENAETCTRRVVSVGERKTGDGGPKDEIRTRGDNNRHDDAWLLRRDNIVGRVVAARRESRRRPVSGGLRGRAMVVLLNGLRPLWTFGRRLRLALYDLVAGVGPVGRVLPQHLRPRVLEFNGRHWVNIKLLSGRREVGHYDCFTQTWRIRRPFHLLVDVRELPAPPRWSLASFVQASSPFLHPRQNSVAPTTPEMVGAAGCVNLENTELTDLSDSVRRLSTACPAASTVVGE